jgi:ribosome biogenesis GTPase
VFEKTGDISPKHGRGRHTTRRTELHSLPGGGWLADTPGFSAMEIGMISALEPCNLGSCFPEFPQGQCRFLDCLHFKEPECAVKQSLLEKKIFPSRYQSYLRMLEELKNIERSR